MKKTYNYFPGANTSKGFYSYYQYLPWETEKIYIIKGGPGTGKSTFMKKIAAKASQLGLTTELHWCSSDNNSLDGIVIQEIKTAILDGTAPHVVDPVYPGAVETIINFSKFWNEKQLIENKTEIIALTTEIKENFNRLYFYLKQASNYIDEQRRLNRQEININQLEKQKNILYKNIMENCSEKADPNFSEIRHLFGTAITPEGTVNYLAEAASQENCFLLTGKPGSGKSYLLEEIATKFHKAGFNILNLHCTLYPTESDAIIIPELNSSIIDSSKPHSITNMITDKNVKTINLNQFLSRTNSDSELINQGYKMLEKGISYLKKAKLIHDDLETYYIQAMDFSLVDKKRKELINKLF